MALSPVVWRLLIVTCVAAASAPIAQGAPQTLQGGEPAAARTPRSNNDANALIELDGIVRSARPDGDDLMLTIAINGDGIMSARVPWNDREYQGLVDSEVRVRGSWASRDGGSDASPGRTLLLRTPQHLRVLAAAPADPFNSSAAPIGDLFRLSPTDIPRHRIKVAGTVTASIDAGPAYITDGEQDLQVRPLDGDRVVLAPGDLIEAVGFVAGTSTIRLVDASVRRIGTTRPPSPARLDASRLVSRDHQHALVTVEAVLLRRTMDDNDYELVLKADGITFEASLRMNAGTAVLDELPDGSLLELTGIAQLRAGSTGERSTFNLRLRDTDDVRILARPSWWTLQHVLYLSGIVLIGFVTSTGWVVALRRRLPAIERARLESEERYRQIFEQAPAGHFVSRDDGTLIACNEAFARMLGFASAAAAVGANCESLYVDPSDRERWLELLRHGGQFENHEVTLQTPDGRSVPALETAVARLNAAGDIAEIQCFVIDLTNQKGAEAALRERDAELQQAQKMEAIGRLAGGVAHDFNNLLTVIAGNIDEALCAARENQLVPTHCLTEVESAGRSAAGLTRQLLAFSRRQPASPSVLDVNAVIAEFKPMLQRLLGEDVQVTVRSCADRLHVHIDRTQLEQVLVNLAVNARDAMPQGGRLVIETGFEEPNVTLLVSDTGSGMDSQVVGRIFEPFFTTKELGRGTGLGLATVYGVVTQSGGTIGVESEVGRGTSFSITLPRVAAVADQREPHDMAQSLTGTETVLVVEDERALRSLADRVLTARGYTVLVAEGGPEALRLARAHEGQIDLLVTDVVMPGLNGSEVARQVSSIRPSVRVLLMSGHTDHPALKEHRTLDVAKLLQKPFTPAALARAVRNALDVAPQQPVYAASGESA